MLDLPCEDPLPIRDVPAEVQEATGHRPHIATVWRWVQRGCRGVKLETALVGGRRITSREAIHRFVEATTAAADGSQITTAAADGSQITAAVRSSARSRSIRDANRDLDSAGI